MHWLLLLLMAPGPSANADRVRAIAKLNEGIKAEMRHDTAKAVQLVKEAITVDPGYAKAHYTLGQLYAKQAHYIDARTTFEAAVTLVGDDEELAGQMNYQLGRMIVADSNEPTRTFVERRTLKREAVQAFDAAIVADPTQYKAHYRRAIAHDWLEDPDAADADFRQCIWLKPEYSPCFVAMAHMYIDYGFAAEGLQVLEAGLRHNDKDPAMWSGAGRAYYDLHRPKDAVDAYKKARAIDPDMIEVLYGLGMAYAELKMRDESVEALQTFLRKAGSDIPDDRKRAANDTLARIKGVF